MTKALKTTAQTEVGTTREPSKLDGLVTLLKKPGGTTMAEMIAITAWQPHSIRSALAGQVRRKGYAVTSDKTGEQRVWRITGVAAPLEAAHQ